MIKYAKTVFLKILRLYIFKRLEIQYLFGLSFNVYREKELFLINYFVKKNSGIIDVGANIGEYTYIFLKNSPRNLYCFEPIPHLNKRLKKIFDNVKVFNFALSDKKSTQRIKIPIEKGQKQFSRSSLNPLVVKSQNFEEIIIQTITLDSWMRQEDVKQIDLIKVDVEGHELKVLQGASQLIKIHKPVIMVEIEFRHSKLDAQKTIDHITESGYKGFFINEQNELITFKKFNFKKYQKKENIKSTKYINNFLFINVKDTSFLEKIKKYAKLK